MVIGAASSAQGRGRKKQPKAPHAAAGSAISELCHDAFLLILAILGSARDVGRCAAVNQAWREAANDAGLWKQILQLERPPLAATVLPLVDQRLPPPSTDGGDGRRLHPWHPKRLLKKHWRMTRFRGHGGADSDDEDGDEEDSKERAARQRKEEEERWKARFRECYLQLTLTDRDDPMRRPVLTKLFPLSDEAIMAELFKGAARKDALCLGNVPDYYQGKERPDTNAEIENADKARRMLPLRLEATLTALDLSGEVPKAAHLLSGFSYDVDDLPGLLVPSDWRDSFKLLPTSATWGRDSGEGYLHRLELHVEDAAEAHDDDARAECKAVAAKAPGRAAHVHFGVRVDLIEGDVENVKMTALEAWEWMDCTWSKLAWK